MNPPDTFGAVSAPQPKATPALSWWSRRDWISEAGIGVVAVAAIGSSAYALAGLADLAGWGHLSVLLPAMVDAYGITATRVWLSKHTRTDHVRKYAAGNALGAIVLSVIGNAVYHATTGGAIRLEGMTLEGVHPSPGAPSIPAWALVVAVSIVPPIIIGLLSHLIALRSADAPDTDAAPAPEQRSAAAPAEQTDRPAAAPTVTAPSLDRPVSLTKGQQTRSTVRTGRPATRTAPKRTAAKRPPVRTDAELFEEAVKADRDHRSEHGRPISAQTLADTLRIGKPKANALVKTVRAHIDNAGEPPASLKVVR